MWSGINDQMKVMIDNALLAFLQFGVARRVDGEHDRFEAAERGCFYNSLGAAAIVYDPGALQRTCAERIAREFLDQIILGTNGDPHSVLQQFERIRNGLGDLHSWQEDILTQLPSPIGQVRLLPESDELVLLLSDLRFTEAGPLSRPWVDQFEGYETRFTQEIRPKILTAIRKQARKTTGKLRRRLREDWIGLPTQLELYPGGIKNSAKVLELLR